MLMGSSVSTGEDSVRSKDMDRTQAESLFQLAVTLRIAYPHRSSYDRRSSLTVAAAIENGERLMAAAPGQIPDVTVPAIWQPAR